MKFAIIGVLPFLNSSKYLDLSYKMDLDFWIVLEGKKLCLITEEIWYPKTGIQSRNGKFMFSNLYLLIQKLSTSCEFL